MAKYVPLLERDSSSSSPAHSFLPNSTSSDSLLDGQPDQDQHPSSTSSRPPSSSSSIHPSAHFLPSQQSLNSREISEILDALDSMELQIRSIRERIRGPPSQFHHTDGGGNNSIKMPQWVGPKLQRYLFLIGFIWQVLVVVLLTLIERVSGLGGIDSAGTQEQQVSIKISIAVMLAFQIVHVFLVIISSVKLSKQVVHKTVNPMFVFQSYLSTLLLFAGVYSLLFQINPHSFSGMTTFIKEEASIDTYIPALSLFFHFLYFSVSTMTSVGYGDIYAAIWYSQLVTICQMLMSVTFTVIIFAQGLSHFNTPKIETETDEERAHRKEQSFSVKAWRLIFGKKR